ncbi:hypothetical protein HMPREF9098_1629 [Kingella denitrificans ATCC 33394]|uniref:Uncharacterized protein n=1 Tax=Kingella denitrificans ATCC 33394 TaxID=888741 RepID=F0F0J4_9NEIS|nr:hypothetical protein HMPREF9098_1629 [Kingella denitrificans ATCC 33394]
MSTAIVFLIKNIHNLPQANFSFPLKLYTNQNQANLFIFQEKSEYAQERGTSISTS